MYIAQQCFGLSDEGIEDALYDSQAIRRFVGIDLARENAPDATTLLKVSSPARDEWTHPQRSSRRSTLTWPNAG